MGLNILIEQQTRCIAVMTKSDQSVTSRLQIHCKFTFNYTKNTTCEAFRVKLKLYNMRIVLKSASAGHTTEIKQDFLQK